MQAMATPQRGKWMCMVVSFPAPGCTAIGPAPRYAMVGDLPLGGSDFAPAEYRVHALPGVRSPMRAVAPSGER